MQAKPHSSHSPLMLVLVALFAFVTVGFNTASYADGPRRLHASHVIAVSVDIAQKVATPAGNHLHIPRHLAHQPQILPVSTGPAISVFAVRQDWVLPQPDLAESRVFTHLLRPPKIKTA